MAPLARVPTVPLQRAIWSRTLHATCKMTPLNRALAHALQRAGFISWFTESGAHPPDASILEQFSPAELRDMHIAHTSNRHKRQLWMGLSYHTNEWKRDNGWWESKDVPVMKTILSKSQKLKAERFVMSPGEVERFVTGAALGEDMWRKGLVEGQGTFLRIDGGGEEDEEWSRKNPVEVLESREAAERGVGGAVICRVWPHRKRAFDEKDSQDKTIWWERVTAGQQTKPE
ncbi:hypothetical protein BKA67DRAFT_564674 [Truncatella angustata]|uniref:Uncharacterized protein n=1 Tax=Truncatella angustata TaxID=152316 RepID=A0A9P8ZXS6_9PEZI|nr:uncharacterized protein BKA67DRAFT_564674 [Truncatella angustata]KAH6654304.1 hypothetical protein BKA67DRAFT_564674 [Truncatella angustata]KAH8203398.1 hypothetical protein TruAng_002382 [Truncatella angustata]